MDVKKLNRREFLIATGALAGTGILAACSSAATVAPGEATVAPAEEPAEEPVEEAPEATVLPTIQVYTELEPPPERAPFDGGPNWDPVDLGGQELIIWGLQYDPHVDRYQNLAQIFAKRTGAKVEVQPQGDIFGGFLTAAAAGTPPDVACMMGLHSHNLIRQQAIVPINEIIFDPLGIDIKKWWRPGAIGCYEHEGQHWGVPTEDNWCGYTVSTRIDLIEQAGGEAQQMWDAAAENIWFDSYEDMFQLAELLQQKDDAGNVSIWGLNSAGWEFNTFSGMLRQQGVDFFDKETQKFDFDNDATITALDLLITQPFERGIEGMLGMSMINAFVAGQVALARGNGSTPGEGWKMDIPGENVIAPSCVAGETPLFYGEGGWGFEMPVNPSHQEAATEFLKFMCTYEAQYTFSQIYGGSPPATWGLVQPELCDIYTGDEPIKRGLRRQLVALENTIFFGMRPVPSGAVGEAVTAVREGTLTPAEAAVQMQERAQADYDQWMSEA